jgi:hypothetical protein
VQPDELERTRRPQHARRVRVELSLLHEAGAESGAGERGSEDG